MEGNELETPAKVLADETLVIRSDTLYFETLTLHSFHDFVFSSR